MKKSIPQLSLPVSFRLAIIAGFLPFTSHGQLTWDTTTGDTVVTEGGGTWAVGTGNWWDGAADQVWADGNTAIFGGGTAGTAGTVTLGSDITTQNVQNGLDFTAPFDGTYTLDLNGNTLTTGGTNSPQRMIVRSGGAVQIDDSVGTGAYLTSTQGNNRFASLSSTLTINAKVTDADGVGTGTNGSMFITGAGGLTFTNPLNDFTGRVGKQNGGSLILTSIADSGVPSAAGAGDTVYIAFNAQLNYQGTGDSTDRTFQFGGTGGTIRSNGTGPLIWTGPFSNTTSGTGATRTLNFRGTNTADNDFQGNLADNVNTLAINKLDAGKWIFSGDNTYTGKTTISAGFLQANAADVAATSGALGNGGIIDFGGGTLQYGPLAAGTDYGSRFGDSTNPMRIDTNGQTVALATIIDGTNTAGLIKNGTGTLSLAGDNVYTGTTIINDGILQVDAADVLDGVDPLITLSGALGAHDAIGATGNIQFGGGTLQYTANSAATDYSPRITGSGSAMIFDTNGQDVTLATALASSNTGGLTKEGAGTLVVDFSNGEYSGLTSVNGGTLRSHHTGGSNQWTAGNFEINNGSRLEIDADATAVFQARTWTFDNSGGGTIDLQGNTIFQSQTNTIVTTGGPKNFVTGDRYNMQNARQINYDVADGSDEIDLEVSVRHDRGFIGKTGDGTVALTNATNNLLDTNSITIEGGVVEIANAGRINSGNWGGPIINDSIFRYNSTANQTMTGVISGTGAIEKDNTGTLTLTAANTYTGDTTVIAGILDLGDGTNNTNLADTSTVTIASGASVNLNYVGTDNVDALILDGVSQPAGVYDSTNAAGFITGTGTLTVAPFTATIYGTWASDNGLDATNNTSTANPDTDGLVNLLEFAFGTNPLVSDSSALLADGSVNGTPIVEFSGSGSGITFEALFVRRDDHGTSGSLAYTVQFSSDLITFEDSTAIPTVVADSSDDSDYEVVSVPYPGLLSSGKPRFFRVKVELVP